MSGQGRRLGEPQGRIYNHLDRGRGATLTRFGNQYLPAKYPRRSLLFLMFVRCSASREFHVNDGVLTDLVA